MKSVTILIPCYNEESTIPLLYPELCKLMEVCPDYKWEMLFVNDGSSDGTLELIQKLRLSDKRVCYLDLSRNFGKENAMLAGFDYAKGDCVVILDADLQDPPSLISEMLKYWEEGYDDVYARRRERGSESWLRKRMSLLYYWLLDKSSRFEILENVGDFRLLDRKCINALKSLRETHRYTKGLFCWIGYNKKELVFDRGDRAKGDSHYSFFKLMALAMEGITSFSIAPLRLSTILGIIISLFAFIYMCYFLVKTLIVGDVVQGFPTLIVVVLFLGGVQLLSIGIIGEYIGRIFIETKNRPVYLVKKCEVNEE